MVVGAGPAGVLASIYLAQQQYDVDVSCCTTTLLHRSHGVLIMKHAVTMSHVVMMFGRLVFDLVQIYEQRERPDPVHRNLDRSYHLAMSHRGMGAVEKVSCTFPAHPAAHCMP